MNNLKIKYTEIRVIKGDITTLKVDAIVNAANNHLVMGGGVAFAIKKKGGKVIEEEATRQGPIEVGEAISTTAGALPCKFVIHAATMGLDFKTDEVKIRQSCRSALTVAERLNISSLAFPALGCGVGRFPELASAKIMAQEVWKHLKKKSSLEEIIFCLFDDNAFALFKKGVIDYLWHITNELGGGPFVCVDIIIELKDRNSGEPSVVVVERSNPPFGLALPGGFVDYGESLESAAKREAKEETGLEVKDLRQFHTYSHPQRDMRFHTVATVFVASAEGEPKAGDDAKGIRLVRLDEIEKLKFAFDHKDILKDYLLYKKGKSPF